MLFAAALTHDVDHLLHPLRLELKEAVGAGGKGGGRAEQRRVHLVGDAGHQVVDHQRIVLHLLPADAGQGLLDQAAKLVVAAVFLKPALERGHLEVARVAGPLQNLVVQDGGDVFHRRAGDHVAGQVEHHDRGRKAQGHGGQHRLGGRLVQAVLQVLQETRAVDLDGRVEREAEVLGERAFARAVKTRDPDADLVVTAINHRLLHACQQAAEGLFDAFGDDVLGDLGLQLRLLRGRVGDDLLDRAVQAFGGVEQGVDRHGEPVDRIRDRTLVSAQRVRNFRSERLSG